MSEPPTIETQRLVLRPHRLDDFQAYCFMVTDREAQRTIPDKTANLEDAWQRFLGALGHWALLDYGLLLIEERVTRRVVGEIGYANFSRDLGPDFDAFPELYWVVTSDVHGHGYALEAAHAMQQWMEANFATERTVCLIDPTNAASLHVAERLGFHAHGRIEYRSKKIFKMRRIMTQS